MSPIATTRRTLSPSDIAGALTGVAVFCFALGSCSIAGWADVGRKLRWASLLVLAGYALWIWLGRRPGRRSLPAASLLAASAWLVALAVVSAAWSVDPRLTVGRAASFALLLLTAIALAAASSEEPRLPSALLVGTLVGAVAVTLMGLAMLGFAHDRAVQPAFAGTPARFRGLGENPDTVALLQGIVLPTALWAAIAARGLVLKAAASASFLLLLGSISASGSRGGLLAACAGGLAFAAVVRLPVKARLVLVAAVLLSVVAAAGGTKIPSVPTAAPTPVGGSSAPSSAPTPVTGSSLPSEYTGGLDSELDRVYHQRSFLSSSGRTKAWIEAVHEGDARPLLGGGFGTEEKIFVDRIYNFEGGHVENSFIGLYLQLGLVGVVSLVALLLATAVGLARATRRSGLVASPAAAAAGVFVGGLALMLVQSYVYSVGNVGTLSFWIVGIVGASLGAAGTASIRVAAAVAVDG